jgi:hypothetical protein
MQYVRQEEFKRNERLELLLKEINDILRPSEDRILETFEKPKNPVILIIGAPRSGTTLMLQWLAESGQFAYPTNLLSRFFGAPCIGAKIQQLLTSPEYNFRDELLDLSNPISLESSLGKTKGALAPNEFWYFWRRFIPNAEPEYLDETALKSIDGKKFLAELAAIESVTEKPFAMKGMILQFNLSFLNNIFDKAILLFIRRRPFYTMQSLLQARVHFYGTIDQWYSVKPKEYDALRKLNPYEQVAGQVYYTNRSIEEELARIDPVKWLRVDYEEFCLNPGQVYALVAERMEKQGHKIRAGYTGPEQFEIRNTIRCSEQECDTISRAYNKISGMNV